MNDKPRQYLPLSKTPILRVLLSRGACIASLGLLACGPPHVALSAPAANAAPQARLESYESLRPRSPAEGSTGIRGGVPSSVLRTSESLQLGNGVQVIRAEDLLPVVDERSAAAKAARRSAHDETVADWATAAGVLLAVVGVGIAVSPFLEPHSGSESINTTPVYLGTGIATLSLPAFLFASSQRRSAANERATTFENYEPALRARLGLCSGPSKPVPCR